MIRRFRRYATLTLATLIGVTPVLADTLSGQLVLQSKNRGQRVSGVFTTPGERARLRIFPMQYSQVIIEINHQIVYQGELSPTSEGPLSLNDKSAVHAGENTLTLTLTEGDVAVAVDYSQLEMAGEDASLKDLQKRELRQIISRYSGTDPNTSLYPGAALLVARGGKILFAEGQGMAQYQGATDGELYPFTAPRKVHADTVFDLASVTKVVSTTAAIMHLVSERRLSLTDTLGELLPGMSGTDKAQITLQQLLTHRAGLWEWQPTWLHKKRSRSSVYAYLAALPLRYSPGEKRAYSDIGFMLLGEIVEHTTGSRLDDYVHNTVFAPLGMNHTRYLPPPEWRSNIAATSLGNGYEQHMVTSGKPYPILDKPPFSNTFSGYRNDVLNGEVNDGNAWYGLEGVAGHAGLFFTVQDLAIFCQTLLNGGGYGNTMLADPETLNQFLQTPFDTNQALGFWRFENGEGRESFGHSGFTGSEIMFRPDDQLIVIMLTNRQHNGLSIDGTYPSVKPAWNALLRALDEFWKSPQV